MAEATFVKGKALRAIEARGVALSSSSPNSLPIHSVRQHKQQSLGQPRNVCFVCGKADHFVDFPSYSVKDAQCLSYGGMGQFARKCTKGGGTPTHISQRSFDGARDDRSSASKSLSNRMLISIRTRSVSVVKVHSNRMCKAMYMLNEVSVCLC